MANRTPDSSTSPSMLTGIPPDGTLCRGVEAVGDDRDFEPRHVEGPLVTRWVPVLDFTQLMIDGAVVDPETLEVVAELGDASMDPELAGLLEQADKADRTTRIEYQNRIARFGVEAIKAILPWVRRPDRGAFAVRVIAAAHPFGAASESVQALESALSFAATPKIEEDILWYLNKLAPRHTTRRRALPSANRSPIQKLLLDPSRPARYMRAWTLWHRILDEVELPNGTKKYLSACHRWNNDSYVDSGDRRIQTTVPLNLLCSLCDQSERMDAQGHGDWSAVTAPWGGNEGVVHLRRDRTWHLAADGGSVEPAQLDSIYLTSCGWWIEASRVKRDGSGDARSPVCEVCVRFVSAGPSGIDEL